MKALQINFSDYSGGGGGAIATYRLFQGLKTLKVNGKIISGVKTLNSEQSSLMPRFRLIEGALKRITKPLGLNDIHALGSFWLPQHPFFQWADVINTHVIHSDYFNYLALPILASQKPTVFTLHDMWTFTGHCAYSYDCTRWQTGCGACPYPDTYPRVQRDSTHLEWLLKSWTYRRTKPTIVTPSRWLTEQAQKSMVGEYAIHHIPNGIDVQTYNPIEKILARQALDLPIDKYILMSCAENLNDYRKGMDLLCKSLNQLPNDIKTNVVLLLMGNHPEGIDQSVHLPIKALGYVSNDRLKALALSASDIFVFSTRADNLPVVLQESLACGTPIVSFDVGGVKDLVRPNITGLLAFAEDTEAFTTNIVTILKNSELHQKMTFQCRETAIKEYPIDLQAQRYKTLYESLVYEKEVLFSNNRCSKL